MHPRRFHERSSGSRLSRRGAGTSERRHRLSHHLEKARRERGERRRERRVAVGGTVRRGRPRASEHHGDEHLETLHANGRLRPQYRCGSRARVRDVLSGVVTLWAGKCAYAGMGG